MRGLLDREPYIEPYRFVEACSHASTASAIVSFQARLHEAMAREHGDKHDPTLAGRPVTVPIVGHDRAAKERVAALTREIGLEAVDVGPLRHGRIIEGLHYPRANALGGRINYHLPRDPARD